MAISEKRHILLLKRFVDWLQTNRNFFAGPELFQDKLFFMPFSYFHSYITNSTSHNKFDRTFKNIHIILVKNDIHFLCKNDFEPFALAG
jgi:hypothetical protein